MLLVASSALGMPAASDSAVGGNLSLALFDMRCKDLGVRPTEAELQRFLAAVQAQASEDQRTVKLRSLQLGSRAGPLLARSLSPSVTSLDLHGNGGLSESGALALIPLIVDGGTLRSLARCGVGTAGAAALGGTLAASNVLQTLSLCRSATRARRRSQRRSRATEGSHHSTSRARGSATARRGGWGSRCRATPGCARCASTTTT